MNLDRRQEVIRAVGLGVGAALALAVAGWPGSAALAAAVGFVGGIVGLLVAFFVEHALEWRAEAERARELDETIDTLNAEKKLLEWRAQCARAEAGINAIHMKVYTDAYIEAQKAGNFLPLAAILARIDVTQKAQGWDKPIPQPGDSTRNT